jgi:(heptosyl)LPS beta-1,4-glucosyltransferase
MNKLSITVVTHNEAQKIERCLKSVQWADEIIIVYSDSTDGTLDICNRYQCKIIQQPWLGFGLMKRFAVDSAAHDWIFSIDSDEEVSTELKTAIQEILKQPHYSGYKIKRTTYYLGKKIQHSGWNRDYPLRLFNRKQGNFNDKPVHESVKLQGERGTIEAPLFHFSYPTVTSHIQKMDRYSDLAAEASFKKGEKSSIFGALMHGTAKFLKMYLLQVGFLDGKEGFVLAYNSAFGVYLKYVKLWNLNR